MKSCLVSLGSLLLAATPLAAIPLAIPAAPAPTDAQVLAKGEAQADGLAADADQHQPPAPERQRRDERVELAALT